jgi:hypothetical protein
MPPTRARKIKFKIAGDRPSTIHLPVTIVVTVTTITNPPPSPRPTPTTMNHRIILSHRPTGPIDTRTFSHSDVPIPTHDELQVGEVVVRVMWLSLVRVLRWLGGEGWALMWRELGGCRIRR